jgi:hypothetical protein
MLYASKNGRQQMKQVITIQGKAKNVFKYTALLAKRQGNTKIKDLKQHNQSLP